MWWSFSIRLFFTDQLPMKYPGIIRPLAASTFVASHNLMWQGRETGMCDKGLGWEGLRNLSLSAQNASPAEGDQSWGEGQSNNHIFSRKQGLETTPDGQRRKIFFFYWNWGRNEITAHVKDFVHSVEVWDAGELHSKATCSESLRNSLEKG